MSGLYPGSAGGGGFGEEVSPAASDGMHFLDAIKSLQCALRDHIVKWAVNHDRDISIDDVIENMEAGVYDIFKAHIHEAEDAIQADEDRLEESPL